MNTKSPLSNILSDIMVQDWTFPWTCKHTHKKNQMFNLNTNMPGETEALDFIKCSQKGLDIEVPFQRTEASN